MNRVGFWQGSVLALLGASIAACSPPDASPLVEDEASAEAAAEAAAEAVAEDASSAEDGSGTDETGIKREKLSSDLETASKRFKEIKTDFTIPGDFQGIWSFSAEQCSEYSLENIDITNGTMTFDGGFRRFTKSGTIVSETRIDLELISYRDFDYYREVTLELNEAGDALTISDKDEVLGEYVFCGKY